jgi:hypothetical protein
MIGNPAALRRLKPTSERSTSDILLTNCPRGAGIVPPTLRRGVGAYSLAELITSIHTNVQVQSSTASETDAKQAAFVELGDAAFEVAGGVLSFAEKSGNRTLV